MSASVPLSSFLLWRWLARRNIPEMAAKPALNAAAGGKAVLTADLKHYHQHQPHH